MQFIRSWVAFLALAGSACSTDPGIRQTSGDDSTGEGTSGGGGSGAGSSTQPGFTFAIPDGGAAAGNSGSGEGTGAVKGEGACGFQKYDLERLPPELLLVLDRSYSMKANVPGSSNNRWVEVTAALDEAIKQTEASVLWGVKMFPSMDGCGVTDPVEVDVAAQNYAGAVGTIKMTGPNEGTLGGTPTSSAVRSATKYLRSRTASRNPKYVLLATDGEPTCRDTDTFNNAGNVSQATIDDTLKAITAAGAAGFRTFVVGIATAGTNAHSILNDMAVSGGEPRQGSTKYYAVANKGDLVTALSQITSSVSSCIFPLDNVPPSPNDVAVTLGGKRVPRDPGQSNGWNYGANMRSIQVYGSWCEGLKNGTHTDANITFGCPGVVIP